MQHLVLFLTILLTHPVSDNKLHHQENNVNGQNRFKCGASTCVRGTMCLSCQVNKFNRICVQLLWVMTLGFIRAFQFCCFVFVFMMQYFDIYIAYLVKYLVTQLPTSLLQNIISLNWQNQISFDAIWLYTM